MQLWSQGRKYAKKIDKFGSFHKFIYKEQPGEKFAGAAN